MFSGSQFPQGTYTFYYGDGISTTVTAACQSTSVGNTSKTCGIFNASHVYVSGGTYSATIVDNTGTTVASTIVNIVGPSVTYTAPQYYTYQYSQLTFSAASSVFTALPDPVTFTATNFEMRRRVTPSISAMVARTVPHGTQRTAQIYIPKVTRMVRTAPFMATLMDSTGATIATITITISETNTKAPTIASITPTSGANGTSVTITGTGFTQGTSACGRGMHGGWNSRRHRSVCRRTCGQWRELCESDDAYLPGWFR